jgi:hypothetical protein
MGNKSLITDYDGQQINQNVKICIAINHSLIPEKGETIPVILR